jgi:hypothetical protein
MILDLHYIFRGGGTGFEFRIFVVALAVWQAVEIWHHGSLFEEVRAWFETKQHSDNLLWRFVSGLAACPFCLSVWVAALLVILEILHLGLFNSILAVSRMANLANDLAWRFCRTPRDNSGEP